jgi:hypothetical protein
MVKNVTSASFISGGGGEKQNTPRKRHLGVFFLSCFLAISLLMVNCTDGGGDKPTPTVTSVTVNSAGGATTLTKGQTLQFSAEVIGTNNPKQDVTWSIEPEVDGATISTNGLLSVAVTAAAHSVNVVATSVADITKSGARHITLHDAVDHVTISSENGITNIAKGGTLQFFAFVGGEGEPAGQDVTWSIDPPVTGASISASGLLTVTNEAPAGGSITVVVTSVVDPSIRDSMVISIDDDPPPPPAVLASIAITTQPGKLVYEVGETLDTHGMVVEATYEDGSKQVVVVSSFSHSVFNTISNAITVTITYTEGSVSKTATFNVSVIGLTPVAADFIVTNNSQTAGAVTAVNVEAAAGKTTGAITVFYFVEGHAVSAIPQTRGTYNIIINAAAAGNYQAVTELELVATLTVGPRTLSTHPLNPDPDIVDGVIQHDTEDFKVSYRPNPVFNVNPATVTVVWESPAAWNEGAAINVFYYTLTHPGGDRVGDRYAAVPTAVGDYEAVISVSAKEGYFDAVEEMHVAYFRIGLTAVYYGTLSIGFTIEQFTDPAVTLFTGTPPTFSVTNGARAIVLTDASISASDVRWSVNNGAYVSGNKTLSLATYTGIGTYTVKVEIFKDGKWYNKTFTFKITL